MISHPHPAHTVHVPYQGRTLHVTLVDNENTIIAKVGKAGEFDNTILDGITRLANLSLSYGADTHEIATTLSRVGGTESLFHHLSEAILLIKGGGAHGQNEDGDVE